MQMQKKSTEIKGIGTVRTYSAMTQFLIANIKHFI